MPRAESVLEQDARTRGVPIHELQPTTGTWGSLDDLDASKVCCKERCRHLGRCSNTPATGSLVANASDRVNSLVATSGIPLPEISMALQSLEPELERALTTACSFAATAVKTHFAKRQNPSAANRLKTDSFSQTRMNLQHALTSKQDTGEIRWVADTRLTCARIQTTKLAKITFTAVRRSIFEDLGRAQFYTRSRPACHRATPSSLLRQCRLDLSIELVLSVAANG
jgi:hypothetical protein